MGVSICAIACGFAFVINTTLTLWVSIRYGIQHGLGTIKEGNCKDTKILNLWLHIVINGLSTILLGTSNCTMQCLVAPTRGEIDRAHRRHDWLDIGVPSMCNLTKIPRKKSVLWSLLALSGIPLHLLYNSTIFQTLSVQQYAIFAGSTEYFGQATQNSSSIIKKEFGSNYQDLKNMTAWERVENQNCIKAYSHQIVSERGAILAISSAVNTSKPLVMINDTSSMDPYSSKSGSHLYDWLCSNYQDEGHYRPVNFTGYWCDPGTLETKEREQLDAVGQFNGQPASR